MKHEIDGCKIILESGKVVGFKFPIAETLVFEEGIVVMLDVPPKSGFNENVYGINFDGQILWQIAARKYVYDDSPYTGIGYKNGMAALYNWDGLESVVDPKTGKVLEEDYRK